MKKSALLFFVITFSLLLFISGCSKDDGNNGTTGPSIDPNDYDFYMVVSEADLSGEYMITVSPIENNTIESLELVVNDYSVTMVNYVNMNMWAGTTTLDQGQTYPVALTMNDIDYSFNMKTAYIPSVNWPEEWIVTEATDLSWSLTADAQYQDLYATATDYTIWDEQYVNLDASARSHTIPANWVDSTLTNYNLLLMEMNFSFDENLICNCMSASEVDYNVSTFNKFKLAKERTLELFNK
ncbi:MAG: hypothetical protein K9N07_02505 [Candidatus Cloacimonetes bacterium]|nr:hypothetical protein [Candidatus Cloacimonadota bacterium]